MSIPLIVNGTTFNYPTDGQNPGWGQAASAWAQAVTIGMLQKSGGNFALTAEVDFGANFGIRLIDLKLRNIANTFRHSFKATNITASVDYELPPTDGSANQVLSTDGMGQLVWNSPLSPPSGLIPIQIDSDGNLGVAATDSVWQPYANILNGDTVTVNGRYVVVKAVVESGGAIVVNAGGLMKALN